MLWQNSGVNCIKFQRRLKLDSDKCELCGCKCDIYDLDEDGLCEKCSAEELRRIREQIAEGMER